MANQEHTHDNDTGFDTVEAYESTPVGDLQQSTQEKTHEAMAAARSKGEHVATEAEGKGDEAQARGQQAAERARATGQQLAGATQKKADEQKNRVADRVDRAADMVRAKSQQMPGGETTRQMAGVAAQKMNQAADYLHQTNTSDMMKRVQDWTRAHPNTALIVAGLFGMYLGRKLFS